MHLATVLENTKLSHDFYLMRAEHQSATAPGQFYMVRGWEQYPLLSRPIRAYDADETTVSLLYKVVGEGTELLARLRPGDPVTLDGPYGNGFPAVTGKIALVGGGVGIAPLYLTAKALRENDPTVTVDIYLGFSDTALLEAQYGAVCDSLTVNVGGFITDEIDPAGYDHVLTCGPDIMMRVLHRKCEASGTPLYVSMENRMACGLGACLVCSCKTADGNRKVCKDGPVFQSKAVYFDV